MLAVVAFAGIASHGQLVVAALYLGDFYYALANASSPLGHSWSLAVEEHFYLLWPLFVPVILRSRNPAALILAMFAAATVWRIAMWPLAPGQHTYFRFDARLTGLLLGAFVALAPLGVVGRRIRDQFGTVSAAIMAVGIVSFEIYTSVSLLIGQTVVEFAAAGLIIAALDRECSIHRLLSWTPLVTVGLWSYAIYLWHFPIAWLLRDRYEWPLVLGGTLAASLLLAVATRRYIEIPMRTFRKSTSTRLQTGSTVVEEGRASTTA